MSEPVDSFVISGGSVLSCGESYTTFCDRAIADGARKLYVPTLDLPEDKLDMLIDYTLGHGAKLIVNCASTLEDVGVIDSRFGRSPLMLMHECGLTEHAEVVSGVYLDKDDLSLMAQEGVPLTVLPTSDAGYGHGVAPVCAALERGVKLKLGTGDGRYNPARNILREAYVLGLLVSAHLNRADAVSMEQLAKMCLPCDVGESEISAVAKQIKIQ